MRVDGVERRKPDARASLAGPIYFGFRPSDEGLFIYIRRQTIIGSVEDGIRLPLYVTFRGSHIRDIFRHWISLL
jgi:hypothetical protein